MSDQLDPNVKFFPPVDVSDVGGEIVCSPDKEGIYRLCVYGRIRTESREVYDVRAEINLSTVKLAELASNDDWASPVEIDGPLYLNFA
jgi:hypothetical protein